MTPKTVSKLTDLQALKNHSSKTRLMFNISGASDCKDFKKQCQTLCLAQSGGVSSAQCWGNPLYCYCKASDGTVFHIDGFECKNASCPDDAQLFLRLKKNTNKDCV